MTVNKNIDNRPLFVKFYATISLKIYKIHKFFKKNYHVFSIVLINIQILNQIYQQT